MKKIFEKLISRKFIICIGGILINIGILPANIPADVNPERIKLITGLCSIYILIEGIIDAIKKERPL